MNIFKLYVERAKIITAAICTCFLAGLIMSFDLWIPKRFFPFAPLLSGLDQFPDFVGWTMLATILICLVSIIFFHTRASVGLLVSLIVGMVAVDQIRLQPWVYIYCWSFVCLYVTYRDSKSLIHCLQIILIGVYFWSGTHKINSNFLDVTFNSIAQNIFSITDDATFRSIRFLGYIIPLIEILCAALLFCRRTRKIGIVIATLIHVSVLIYVSPMGINKNHIVIPWNIAMIILVVTCFYENDESVVDLRSARYRIMNVLLMLIFWLAPFFNFFSLWDSYLSFSLYSDKVSFYYIAVEDSELSNIDYRLIPYLVQFPNTEGGKFIDIDQWSTAELHVPFYPEDRVFKKISKRFCGLGIPFGKLAFLKVSHYPVRNQYSTFNCQTNLHDH